jgi:aromatic ring hydroxylase
LINGIKLWCTNSVIADYIVVMAQTPAIMVRGKERKQYWLLSSIPNRRALRFSTAAALWA